MVKIFKRKQNNGQGKLILKECRFRGINTDGRYMIECNVTVEDKRIPYKSTKAIVLIGEANPQVEVKAESG